MEPANMLNPVETLRDKHREEAKQLALRDLHALGLEMSPHRDQLLLQAFMWWMDKLTAPAPFNFINPFTQNGLPNLWGATHHTVLQIPQHICHFIGRDTTGGGYCESCGKREPGPDRPIVIG